MQRRISASALAMKRRSPERVNAVQEGADGIARTAPRTVIRTGHRTTRGSGRVMIQPPEDMLAPIVDGDDPLRQTDHGGARRGIAGQEVVVREAGGVAVLGCSAPPRLERSVGSTPGGSRLTPPCNARCARRGRH